jgi:S1-C subfamily serine protease
MVGNVFADAVDHAQVGVVAVQGRHRLPATGTVWSVDETSAVIVTASHVIEREERITVRLGSGQEVAATLLGRDLSRDLAVLRIETTELTPVTLATAEARVGTLVMAIGRPFATEPQASLGTVVFVGSLRFRSYRTGCLIHADPSLYPGFSGGPLINSEGMVLGINTSGVRQVGSFTIPARQIDRVVADIVELGYVRTAWIGITVKRVELSEAAREAFPDQQTGVVVTGFQENAPASEAGLYVGDILITVDEQPLEDVTDLRQILCDEHIGEPLQTVVWRNDERHDISITPVARPEQPCG